MRWETSCKLLACTVDALLDCTYALAAESVRLLWWQKRCKIPESYHTRNTIGAVRCLTPSGPFTSLSIHVNYGKWTTWECLSEVRSACALTTALLLSPMSVDFALPTAGCTADMFAAPSSLISSANCKQGKLHTGDTGLQQRKGNCFLLSPIALANRHRLPSSQDAVAHDCRASQATAATDSDRLLTR